MVFGHVAVASDSLDLPCIVAAPAPANGKQAIDIILFGMLFRRGLQLQARTGISIHQVDLTG